MDPVARIKQYIAAVKQDVITSQCAIEAHFQDEHHGVGDLSVTFVDGVPPYGHNSSGVKAVRVRLENIWMRRIFGERKKGLNIRCQSHRSMASGSAQHPSVIL